MLRAGGQPLLRWFRKLAVLRGIKGVHDLRQGPGEAQTGVEEAEAETMEDAGQELQREEAENQEELLQGQGSRQAEGEGSVAPPQQSANVAVEAGAVAESAAAEGAERQAAAKEAAATTPEPPQRAALSG